MIRLACLLALLALPVRAEQLPALHSVTGVAADDVLNIRAAPSAEADVIGTLAPDASGVEVLAVNDGWATVNAGEQTGFVALRFLARDPGPDWNTLRSPLSCLGTEPFWSLTLDPAAGQATTMTPEDTEPQSLRIGTVWPALPWSPNAALSLPTGIAVLSPAECSDGMSDRSYAIAIDVFLTGTSGERLSGCCLLVQP